MRMKRRRFARISSRKDLLPKILIVTQKLLTGFDAPILYCMYLDKPMRDHVLLQAIARVNRPYEDDDGLVKPCGFVLDFVGIFEKLEKALAFDSDVVASIIKNIDTLRMLFKTYMEDVAKPYLALAQGWDDKSKEKAIEYFADKEVREGPSSGSSSRCRTSTTYYRLMRSCDPISMTTRISQDSTGSSAIRTAISMWIKSLQTRPRICCAKRRQEAI